MPFSFLRPGLGRVLLLAVILFLPGLGRMPITGADEARYASAAREMRQRGELGIPTYNGRLRLNKPIFFYWLLLLSYRFLGVSAFSARLPSAICGLLLVVLLEWAWRQKRGEQGPGAGTVAASMLGIFVLARLTLTDMSLMLFITATLLALWPLWERPEGRNFRWPSALLAGVAAAGAMLTKGPIGWLLPLLACILFTFWERRWSFWRRGELWLAVLIAVMLSVPWFLYLWQRVGPRPVLAFFGIENLQRYAVPRGGHQGPFWYYLPVLWLASLPWSGFLWREFLSLRREATLESRFAASLLAGVLTFFSFGATKLPHYLAPALPAAAWLAAEGWSKSWRHPWERWLVVGLTVPPLILLASGFVLLPEIWARSGTFPLEWGSQGRRWLRTGFIVPSVVMLVLIMGLRRDRPSPFFSRYFPCTAGLMLLETWLRAAVVISLLLEPVVQLAKMGQERCSPRGELYVVGVPVEFADVATFYAGGLRVRHGKEVNPDKLREVLSFPRNYALLRCSERPPDVETVKELRGWCLIAGKQKPP